MNWTHCALSALLVLAGVPAAAQTVLHEDDFEGPATWQVHGLWNVDGSPSSVSGGAAYSGTKSLNFNNGTDYAGTARGAVSSPVIDVAAGSALRIAFRCNYETETTGTRYDQRRVVIRLDSNVVQRQQLAGSRSVPSANRCASMGTWHRHELPLQVPAGSARVRLHVEFEFNSIDAIQNAHPGWFVDDFQVVEVGTPNATVFNQITRTTNTFRDLNTTIVIKADRSVEVRRSSPTARYALISGTASGAEWQALTQAVQNGRLASIPSSIPDPNTYIVRPTSVLLEVDSPVSTTHNTIGASLGVYGQWAAQLTPVMRAIEAILDRLIGNGQPSGDDHGNDAQGATDLTLDGPALNGKIDPAGDVDFFKVADTNPVIAIFPPPLRTYTFETTVQGNMDTKIELYASDGTTLLATNDDGGQGLASRIVYTGNAGSTFHVKVFHWSSQGTGDYTVRASATGITPPPIPSPDDHADGPQGATTIQVDGSTNAGEIESGGDQDWFQINQIVIAIFPPPTFTYTIQTTVQGNMDTVIEVYAADGVTLLASNDDAPGLGLASKVTYTGQAGTLRYVKVRHYSGSGTGSYTLKVSTTP